MRCRMRRPSRCSEILMVRFPADGGEIEAKINRKGFKRHFSRKLDAKQIVLQKVCREEEELEEKPKKINSCV